MLQNSYSKGEENVRQRKRERERKGTLNIENEVGKDIDGEGPGRD